MSKRSNHWFVASFFISLVWIGNSAEAQNEPTAKAPPRHGILEHTSTGVMYVEQDLLKTYKAVKERVDSLRGRIFRSPEVGKVIREELKTAAAELRTLREKIDETKVHVEPFQVFSRRDTQSFKLGESQQIVITSDDINVRGWNGDKIKCVVERFVLSEEEPAEEEFDTIIVKHEERMADDLVGMSDADREVYEQQYLASEAAQKFTEQQLQGRVKLNAEIRGSYLMYQPLQGHAVDVLEIGGLHGQEGNKHLTGRTESRGGSATMGGYWKRSAKVTIYVPKCKHVVLRSCKKAVDVKSVEANLIVTTHGSQDTSYGSDFSINDIKGDVVIHQAPIREIHGVTGKLKIQQTDEYTNTGTAHRGKFRTSSSPPPDATNISAIGGDLSAQFVRADLHLSDISGVIDVQNEYGNTEIDLAQPLTEAAHRIVSHSGVVRAITPKADSAGIPVFAFTQTGSAQVAFGRDKFDDKSFGSGGRSWYGFQSVGVEFGFFAMRRPQSAWSNEDRGKGIDLISNAGTVTVGPASTE